MFYNVVCVFSIQQIRIILNKLKVVVKQQNLSKWTTDINVKSNLKIILLTSLDLSVAPKHFSAGPHLGL